MTALSRDATEASRMRHEIARRLADACPQELGQEIALTGSAARGIADEYSDIEMKFWIEGEPDLDRAAAWLEGMGATELAPSPWTDADGSRWITCSIDECWAELGWLSMERFEAVLRRVLAAEPGLTEAELQIGWVLDHALPLRTAGRLARWKEAASRYPDALEGRMIRANTQAWSDPHVPGVRWALVRRGQRMALAQRLLWDMDNVLNVLWAVNRRWPQDQKWLDDRSLDLPIAPPRLAARINAVFGFEGGAEIAVRTALELIEDTLLLVPPEYDVSAALISVRKALGEAEVPRE